MELTIDEKLLNIVVCVKQVPSSTRIEVDEKTGVLKRDGVAVKTNPYDLFALETALRIKKQTGAHITALTMGPPQAAAVLHEAVYMGADDGLLLSDRRFAGADVFATASALAGCIRAVAAPDIIICGKQTTDGDTGQVGAELAELLSMTYSANITKVMNVNEQYITAVCGLETADYEIKLAYPCVISVEKNINTPRLPSYKIKFETGDVSKKIKTLTLDDLQNNDENYFGLKGSPTQVEKIFPPQIEKQRLQYSGEVKVLADKLFSALKEKKFL